MQFGFRPGKGTIDAMFIVRQMQEKHGNKVKKFYYAFVDLNEKLNYHFHIHFILPESRVSQLHDSCYSIGLSVLLLRNCF